MIDTSRIPKIPSFTLPALIARIGSRLPQFPAALSAYLQMVSRQEDPDTLFFNRSLAIEGDTELGLRVKNMLDALEWPALSWQGLRPTFLGRG